MKSEIPVQAGDSWEEKLFGKIDSLFEKVFYKVIFCVALLMTVHIIVFMLRGFRQ